MRIATYLDTNGELGDFFKAGSICVFEKRDGQWEKASAVPLALNANMSLSEMKEMLGKAVHPIAECKVFLIRELRGVFKVFLEDWGFHVWKSIGTLEEQLDQVVQHEQSAPQEEPQPIMPQPVDDTESGFYYINLIEQMRSGIPHVSREILLPFFDTVSFAQLEIISDHLPRWLPFELDDLGLRIESKTSNPQDKGLRIVIVPASGSHSCPKGRRRRNFSCSCGG
jgi:Fe-only nitrogenase accessory protein AnfO